MTLIQKIKLAAIHALVAPLLERTARTWSFEAGRRALERALDALQRRDSADTPSAREITAWREIIINQRRSLRLLRLHLLEQTQVWTGATYIPVEQLDRAGLLGALEMRTKEALESLDLIEQITPNLLERTVYSKLNVTRRCALCMQLAPFSAIKHSK